jgi:nitrite reductase [NAD(P)H] small subunit
VSSQAATAPAATAGWTRVGRAQDVPALEGRSAEAGGRRIAIFRLADGWAATDATCPHRGGPLQDGLVADRCITCPLHGRRFDVTSGEQHGGDDTVVVHEVVEREGELWVRLAATA